MFVLFMLYTWFCKYLSFKCSFLLWFKVYGVVFIHFLIVHEIVFWDFRHVQLQAFVLPFHVVDAAIGRNNFNRHAPKRRANPVQKASLRAHPDLNQGPADLQSAALTAELCTRLLQELSGRKCRSNMPD